jgi:hypothetical protein
MGVKIPDDIFAKVKTEDSSNNRNRNINYLNMFGAAIEAKLVRKEHEIWDEKEIAPFIGKAHKYILNRGISLETCKEWQIGYAPDSKRVIFPIRRRDGTLVGAMGRDVTGTSSAKYLPPMPFSKSMYLYGEHRSKQDTQKTSLELSDSGLPAKNGVILVEGMMDVLRLYEAGYKENVLGVMSATISDHHVRTLADLRRTVYLMLDWDMAGVRGRKVCVDKLYEHVMLYDVPGISVCVFCGDRWSRVVEVDRHRTHVCSKCGQMWAVDRNKKDPDQLTSAEIIDCLKSAKRVKKT